MTRSGTVPVEKGTALRGKTVVITRARAQAGEFRCRLMDLGAEVIEFPTIEIVPPESWAPVDRALDRLHTYDWIVFTSANGVRFFMSRFQERGKSRDELEGIRFCAIGPRTARELEEANIRVHVMPAEYRAEAVAESLKREGLVGKQVLLARAKKARAVLPRELRRQGARVDVVEVYQTVQPKGETRHLLRLLEERRVDAIAFTSSSTVANFMEMFASHRDELMRGLEHVAIAVIGPITKERAIELGLPVHISPTEYTIPALAEAIATFLSSEG